MISFRVLKVREIPTDSDNGVSRLVLNDYTLEGMDTESGETWQEDFTVSLTENGPEFWAENGPVEVLIAIDTFNGYR